MGDREKVIKLDVRIQSDSEEWDTIELPIEQAKDILALLKEQEPASPTWIQGKAYCGKCGQRLPRKRADMEINYCSYCGQEVKWNG